MNGAGKMGVYVIKESDGRFLRDERTNWWTMEIEQSKPFATSELAVSIVRMLPGSQCSIIRVPMCKVCGKHSYAMFTETVVENICDSCYFFLPIRIKDAISFPELEA